MSIASGDLSQRGTRRPRRVCARAVLRNLKCKMRKIEERVDKLEKIIFHQANTEKPLIDPNEAPAGYIAVPFVSCEKCSMFRPNGEGCSRPAISCHPGYPRTAYGRKDRGDVMFVPGWKDYEKP